MKLKVSEIVVGERVRKETGDLALLKQSIKTVGLINPVVVNENNELLAGFRRLQACKELEYEEVEVTVVSMQGDKVKMLDWEYHENLGRKDLSTEDKQIYFDERDRLLTPPPAPGFWGKLKALWQKFLGLFKKK